jgi:hypothetical protein
VGSPRIDPGRGRPSQEQAEQPIVSDGGPGAGGLIMERVTTRGGPCGSADPPERTAHRTLHLLRAVPIDVPVAWRRRLLDSDVARPVTDEALTRQVDCP